MDSVLDKYLTRKKDELINYISYALKIFNYDSFKLSDVKIIQLKKIINIYLNKYYKVTSPVFIEGSKYFTFDENTDIEYKALVESIIIYFNSIDLDINKNTPLLLFYSHLCYLALLIDRLRETILIVPNKIDFINSIANKVTNNFIFKKNKESKNNANKLIKIISDYQKYHKKLIDNLENIHNSNSYNLYINLNEQAKLIKCDYQYEIKKLESHAKKDVKKVFDLENIAYDFKIISFELALILLLKCLLKNERYHVAIELDKVFYKKKSNINKFCKLLSNNYTIEYSKILIQANQYEDNENIKLIKKTGIKILIETDDFNEIKNINFDEKMILLTSEKLINDNKLYLESKKIKYLNKTTKRVYKEDDLFITNLTFMEE